MKINIIHDSIYLYYNYFIKEKYEIIFGMVISNTFLKNNMDMYKLLLGFKN